MKHLHIKSTQYNYLEKNFAEWLDILGYSQSSIKNLPVHIREFFHYLEQNNVDSITQVKAKHITDFIRYLKMRPNLMHGGGLSACSINHNILAINAFIRYLSASGKHHLGISPRRVPADIEPRIILSKAE